MNILVLEHPRIPSEKHFNDIANTPLWSCLMAGYVAAALQNAGHPVSVLDATRWTFDRLLDPVIRVAPDLICVHAVYFWEHTDRLFSFLDDLRQKGFSGHINLFGFFPTLSHQALLKECPSVDSIAAGECEWTLVDLVDRLKRGAPVDRLPGLALRDSRGVVTVAPRKPDRDPDAFPVPLRKLKENETVSVLASRGCYNHCRFCPIPVFYNNGPMWRGRKPEAVYEEIEGLKAEGAKDFYFVDPNFIGPGKRGRDRVRKLAELLRPLGITFGMETRAEDLDIETLDALISSGLKSLLIGIESGSPQVLGDLNKHATTTSAENAIALCRARGIEPEIGFLMFVPDSTRTDIAENFTFLKQNHLLDRLERTANLLSHRQIIFSGTSGYRRFEEEGRIASAGFLGFQVEVEWRDPWVLWAGDIIGQACLFVLKEMGKPESPIFWAKQNVRHRAVNGYLVGLFERLLVDAPGWQRSDPSDVIKERMERDLTGKIHSS